MASSYQGVRKLQEYLETNKAVVGFTKSLKDADGTFDGEYGPDTDEAFWAWLEKLPEGSDLSSLVPHVLSAEEYSQVRQAQREYDPRRPAPSEEDLPADLPPVSDPADLPPVPDPAMPLPKAEEGWPAWKWLLLGVGVATVGLVAYTVVKSGSPAAAKAVKPGVAG